MVWLKETVQHPDRDYSPASLIEGIECIEHVVKCNSGVQVASWVQLQITSVRRFST